MIASKEEELTDWKEEREGESKERVKVLDPRRRGRYGGTQRLKNEGGWVAQ